MGRGHDRGVRHRGLIERSRVYATNLMVVAGTKMADLFAHVRTVGNQFALDVNKATEETRAEVPLSFYTVVSKALDESIKGEDLSYVTLALNLNVSYGEGNEDLRGIIDKKKITKDIRRTDSLRYNEWAEKQLETQIAMARTKFLAEATLLKRNSTKDETAELTEEEREETVQDAIKFEKSVGPRYHNVIKLRFVGTRGNCVAILDSWFYYSLPTIGKTVKTLFGKDLNRLFKMMKQFVFGIIGAKAFTLLDGWSGYNKDTKVSMDSGDLSRVAKKYLGSSKPRLLKAKGDIIISNTWMNESPENKTRQTVQDFIAKGGYYGQYEFFTRERLQEMFPEVNADPVVQEAFDVVCFGNAQEYSSSQQLICVADIELLAVNSETEAEMRLKVSFGSNPAKIISQALGVDRSTVKVTFPPETSVNPLQATLYDLCDPEGASLADTMDTLKLRCFYKIEEIPKMASLEGGAAPRRSARLAREPSLQCFVDMCA